MAMYSNAPEGLDRHNLHMSQQMWNESKDNRAVAHGQVKKSEKKKVHVYYARNARRQPVQLWQLKAMLRTLLLENEAPPQSVCDWAALMERVVRQRYADRVARVKVIDEATRKKIEAMTGAVKLAAEALFASTAEGTLHPERSADGGTMFFTMPEYIASGNITVAAPFPLPRGSTEVPVDLTAAEAQLAEEAESEGSDVEDEEADGGEPRSSMQINSEEDDSDDDDSEEEEQEEEEQEDDDDGEEEDSD